MSSSSHNDLRPLAQAMSSAVAVDGVQNALTLEQWDLLAPYLVPVTLAAGELLFAEGSLDRNLYFVESGSLSVHYQDAKERIRLAIVGPGSILGEGAFFAHRARHATVQAAAPGRLWCLTAMRFAELSNRQPGVALALVMAAGQVLPGSLSGTGHPAAAVHRTAGKHLGRGALRARGGDRPAFALRQIDTAVLLRPCSKCRKVAGTMPRVCDYS